MSLAVLERNRQKYSQSKVIRAGLKLLCYSDYYGFTCNRYYRIYEIKGSYITVRDDDKKDVIFTSSEDLRNIFYIIYE